MFLEAREKKTMVILKSLVILSHVVTQKAGNMPNKLDKVAK